LSYQIVEQSVKTMPEDHIVSADRYFINNRGQYLFQPSKLTEAHDFAQQQFARRASQGLSPLIVDNTNVEAWEMYYYLQVASQYGYHIEIMEPNTPWKSAPALLAKKTQHGVPKDKIDNMKTRFEKGPIENLMKSLNLQVVREPKMRNIPPLEAVKETAEVQKPVIKSPTPPPPLAVKSASSFQWTLPSDIWDATGELNSFF
jgi:predicted kinase